MIGRLAIDTVIPGHGRHFGTIDEALERAFKRLAAFEADPTRMARNALKACFIFNLLDLQSLPRAGLEAYLDDIPIFHDVGTRLLGMDIPALTGWLLDELKKVGAIDEFDGQLRPTMAA
jgi:hypothetical protein